MSIIFDGIHEMAVVCRMLVGDVEIKPWEKPRPINESKLNRWCFE